MTCKQRFCFLGVVAKVRQVSWAKVAISNGKKKEEYLVLLRHPGNTMRVIFEVGLEPFHLFNKYGGVLLFLVIACLTLVPLASMYVVLAVVCCFLNEFSYDGQNEMLASVLGGLRICAQATLYFSVSFPFIMAMISTYMSYRMMEGHLMGRHENETRQSSANVFPALLIYLNSYSIVRLTSINI